MSTPSRNLGLGLGLGSSTAGGRARLALRASADAFAVTDTASTLGGTKTVLQTDALAPTDSVVTAKS
jgi:hypothetical protein